MDREERIALLCEILAELSDEELMALGEVIDQTKNPPLLEGICGASLAR